MFTARTDRPADWKTANIYTFSDWHIGDQHCDHTAIDAMIETASSDQFGLVVLNGDLLNTATKTGPSDVYGETMSPMAGITMLTRMLEKVSGKVIAATCGNHESRIYKQDGIDVMRLVCRELGIETKYDPAGVLCFLSFGEKTATHHDKPQPMRYTAYVTHGSGGGRREGAKTVRLADMATIVDADIYIHGHTHLPVVMKEDYFRVNIGNGSVNSVTKLFVNASAQLQYGGYGQTYEFKPASIQTPVIHLDGRQRYMTATL